MPELWTIDYVVMGLHLSLMVGIGLFFYNYVRSANDFFKSSNRLPWAVAGLSSFMSSFSAWSFTGGAGKMYDDGISGAAILWTSAVALLLSYFIFAKRSLLKFCEQNGVPYYPFKTFADVQKIVEQLSSKKKVKKRHRALLKRKEAYCQG